MENTISPVMVRRKKKKGKTRCGFINSKKGSLNELQKWVLKAVETSGLNLKEFSASIGASDHYITKILNKPNQQKINIVYAERIRKLVGSKCLPLSCLFYETLDFRRNRSASHKEPTPRKRRRKPVDFTERKCLKCGRIIVGFYVCQNCFEKNTEIAENEGFTKGVYNDGDPKNGDYQY